MWLAQDVGHAVFSCQNKLPVVSTSTKSQVKLTNLKPCTSYHFRVISQDRYGNEAKSEEDEFTTLGLPATFDLTNLSISPTTVEVNEDITVSVISTNSGDCPGTCKVIFRLGSVLVATKDVTVSGGASQKIVVTASTDVIGTHTVTVNGLSDTFEVAEPPLEPPPRPIHEPITPSEPPIEPDVPEAPTNWRLIGSIIGGCVAAGLSVYFYIKKKRRLTIST